MLVPGGHQIEVTINLKNFEKDLSSHVVLHGPAWIYILYIYIYIFYLYSRERYIYIHIYIIIYISYIFYMNLYECSLMFFVFFVSLWSPSTFSDQGKRFQDLSDGTAPRSWTGAPRAPSRKCSGGHRAIRRPKNRETKWSKLQTSTNITTFITDYHYFIHFYTRFHFSFFLEVAMLGMEIMISPVLGNCTTEIEIERDGYPLISWTPRTKTIERLRGCGIRCVLFPACKPVHSLHPDFIFFFPSAKTRA